MFNLFKKTDQQAVEVSEKQRYPQAVQEIHSEFLTAGDKILEEATCLLKELETKDLAKGKRLAALGFGKTREAALAIKTEGELVAIKEIADLVMRYKANYPTNKFITNSQVEQICEKYGLVCGDTSLYKGFVPENKLLLIEQFKLKENYVAAIIDSWHSDEVVGFLTKTEMTDSGLRQIQNGGYCYVIAGNDSKEENVKNAKKYSTLGSGLDGGGYENQRYLKAVPYAPNICFKICAPLKDMEIPEGKELKGYKIQNIPDPVVLHPVHGGYLIVCAWGDEASDEMVVNEKMN